MPFPVRPAPLRHLLRGDRAVGGAPFRAQEEPCAPPSALTAGPPPDDPWTDLVRRKIGVRAGLDDPRHPTLMVQGRPVPRVVQPTTHRRARRTLARPRATVPSIRCPRIPPRATGSPVAADTSAAGPPADPGRPTAVDPARLDDPRPVVLVIPRTAAPPPQRGPMAPPPPALAGAGDGARRRSGGWLGAGPRWRRYGRRQPHEG